MGDEKVERVFSPKNKMLPTHVLKVKEREGQGTTTIGAGWEQDDGSISIKLSPCVVLSWQDDVTIMLFTKRP